MTVRKSVILILLNFFPFQNVPINQVFGDVLEVKKTSI